MTLTRADSLADWLTAVEAAGVVHEPDCSFMAWADEQNPAMPVETLFADAPPEQCLAAALRILHDMPDHDPAFWAGLVAQCSPSDTVIRWAKARAS